MHSSARPSVPSETPAWARTAGSAPPHAPQNIPKTANPSSVRARPGAPATVPSSICESLAPMRAVAIPAPGGPEILTVVDRDGRAPGPGEVRIAVRSRAFNPHNIGLHKIGAGQGLEPPWVQGMVGAGIVESV